MVAQNYKSFGWYGRVLAVAVTASLVVACSSNRPQAQLKETFVTNINEQGEKAFQLTIEMQMPERGRKGRGKPPPGGPPGGKPPGGMGGKPPGGRADMESMPNFDDHDKMMRSRMLERLALKLEESAYCRQGYELIDESIQFGGRGWLRGACRELASDEDREKFVNNSAGSRKVTIESLD